MREVILTANWKMHKTISEGIEFIECFKEKISGKPKVIICPSFTALSSIKEAIGNSNLDLGAQNLFYEKQGAFTGEISPVMLKDVGAKYVIIGHSERRHIFGETDELINKKLFSAIDSDIIPIFCVGETIDERQAGHTEDTIFRQITEGLKGMSKENVEKIIIAYEPVWAIGTGLNAQPEQASVVHRFIRDALNKMFGEKLGESMTILYGGSIKEDNIESLGKMEDIDGGLVGGASLQCKSFLAIWEKLKAIKNI
jgi:triosephosphate isomerase